MEMEFVAEDVSEDDTVSLDQNIDDYLTFEGERCGICMTIVIDRGVLDCCQHWFCFTCIDNWSTITNLCPLCQKEFQLITCLPVYDTVGSNKADEDSSGEDEWCIEGKNNTLSFPSYYIDENAVKCLDGDGCKIRSRSMTIEDDTNLDTSIACDSCDIWYHAFCVGFDPEGTCENSWLCPRCVANENPQKSEVIAVPKTSNHCHPENTSSECSVEAAFSGKVSISVADAGETAVVVSMVEGNQVREQPSGKLPSTSGINKDLKIEMLIPNSSTSGPKLDTDLTEKTSNQPVLEAQQLEQCLSEDASCCLPSSSLQQSELNTASADKLMKEPSGHDAFVLSSKKSLSKSYSATETHESSLDLHLGLSMGCSLSVDDTKNDVAGDQAAGEMQQTNNSEEYLLSGGKIMPNLKENVHGITSAKRKLRDYSTDVYSAAEDRETKARVETKHLSKKFRTERYSRVIDSKDQAGESSSDESQICNLEKGNAASDIMSIVQETDRSTNKSSKERETAAGLRVKKIMRRVAEDKESSILVQKLRKEIRDAVRNKSSKEIGENLFDPKLLAAFRVAVAGSITEPAKKPPALVVKAKKLMLQKGKVRENLTKKIYGIGGRRKRAWTRDCEIEFWKHRCSEAGKPEKIETLNSVLNLLRNSCDSVEIKGGTEEKATNPILSRLYLADTSVFPRKDDVKPVSDLKTTGSAENKGPPIMEKVSFPSLGNHTTNTSQINKVSPQFGVHPSNDKGNKFTTVLSVKNEGASRKVHSNKCPEGPSASSSTSSKVNSHKEMMSKSDDIKKDKRKWALEVLARKAAATGSNASQEKQEDNAALKGNYPLLVQLPIDMRPVMAPSRHNKIPISVRQAQLYRLTEHFLRKANLPVICRTADTELAVADAVNIEKEVADRSNSKLVYVNLMSQELLHRSDNIKSTESDPSPTSPIATDRLEQESNDLSDDLTIEEALKNAGLLSDSPPNSPYHPMEEVSNENDLSKKNTREEPENVFEMDSNPEFDIYGDFEYDLEDDDFIGASALKVSKLREEGSKMKVLFSTLYSDRSNSSRELEGHDRTTNVEVAKGSSCLHESGTDMSMGGSSMGVITRDCLNEDPPTDEGSEEPFLAECEELYGPDKEPLVKRFPDSALMQPCELMANDVVTEKIEHSGLSQTVKASELGSTDSCAENLVVVTVGLHASGGENAPGGSQTCENVSVREKLSDTDTNKQSDDPNSVYKKVQAYIKEHVRPLCKSGVITVEQYRWAVGKTTEKVMKYHSKEKNANFLIKEGEKVKKLAGQYVEAAQQMKENKS